MRAAGRGEGGANDGQGVKAGQGAARRQRALDGKHRPRQHEHSLLWLLLEEGHRRSHVALHLLPHWVERHLASAEEVRSQHGRQRHVRNVDHLGPEVERLGDGGTHPLSLLLGDLARRLPRAHVGVGLADGLRVERVAHE